MERHQGYLEEKAHHKQYHGGQHQGIGLNQQVEILKVERAGSTIEEGKTKQQDGRRKDGHEHVFGTSFSRVVLVLIKGNQGSHRQRSHFKTNIKEDEMPG